MPPDQFSDLKDVIDRAYGSSDYAVFQWMRNRGIDTDRMAYKVTPVVVDFYGKKDGAC